MVSTATSSGSRRLVAGLVLALAAWGIYLAVGATGMFTDAGLFDTRRSLIVLGCSATFLAAWLLFLVRARVAAPPGIRTSRNVCSAASLPLAALAYAVWSAAWAAWQRGNPHHLTQIFGWTSVVLFSLAAILAMIGLSDSQRVRWKLWGLVTLLLLLVAAAGFVWQVRSYSTRSRLPPRPATEVETPVEESR
jgi:hypothetical protein